MSAHPGAHRVVFETWDSFWTGTSISGVSNAGRARASLIRRVIWILIFLVGMAVTAWALSSVVADYLTYPVTTSVFFQHKTTGVSDQYMCIVYTYTASVIMKMFCSISLLDRISGCHHLQPEQSRLR